MKKMKCRTEDYTEADFPATRKDVFFDCFREHFSVILKLCFLCFLCFLPVFFVMLLRDLHLAASIKSLGENPDKDVLASVVKFVSLVYGGAEVVAFAIFGFLFAGIAQILRQLCWGEPIFFGEDFKTGLKSNGARFLVISLLAALTRYAASVTDTWVSMYLLPPMFYVITLPIGIWFLLQSVYYKLGVVPCVKNSVLFYVKTVPFTLLLLALTVAPTFVVKTFVANFAAKYLTTLLAALIYYVPITMVWLLYAGYVFDKFINKEHYPSYYRKGMLKEKSKEDN